LHKDGVIVGHPEPIIRFKLDKKVNPIEFLHSIWNSSVLVKSSAMEIPLICEDHSGWTAILSDKELDGWSDRIDDANFELDKQIKFDGGLPPYGHPIPFDFFALKRNLLK
jgi:hypothetical protein